jgi:hypothetical protein
MDPFKQDRPYLRSRALMDVQPTVGIVFSDAKAYPQLKSQPGFATHGRAVYFANADLRPTADVSFEYSNPVPYRPLVPPDLRTSHQPIVTSNVPLYLHKDLE